MRNFGLTRIACTITLFCTATAVASSAQTVTTVLQFDSLNGGHPTAPLIQAADGNLWGTTEVGGKATVGNVFAMTTAGAVPHAYGFCASSCPEVPEAPVVQDVNGDFYGTTESGGTKGYGTVFKVTPTGHVTTLYSFCSQTNCTDGERPTAGLVLGINGNLYGTTTQGGKYSTGINSPGGTVFEITVAGQLTTIYSFCKIVKIGICFDGEEPSGLVLGSDGSFYGTTTHGGANFGTGSIFKISPTGQLRQIYSFCIGSIQCPDGAIPKGALVEGGDGNFYGTASTGGAGSGQAGTVFKTTPTGQLTTLYSFCSLSQCADGETPVAGLVQGTDGNFYGTTYFGGNNNFTCNASSCGTLFQITPAGTFTLLYSFCSQSGCADGWAPSSAVMQATNGTFYGTIFAGGVTGNGCFGVYSGCGTVFSLSMGLEPFVQANPGFGRVGNEVGILGNNLSGTTSVTFNGTPATFTVVSGTLIKAQLPTGATTGTIQVATPSGTLSSNVAFHVIP